MRFKTSKYNQKVSFIQYGTTTDGAGGTVPSETTILITFARVSQPKGGQMSLQDQIELLRYYEIGVQYRNGFQPNASMRIKYKGRELEIKGVKVSNEQLPFEWVIMATETQ
jgi:SPP1 family predicted phage head-tail adaptor